MSKVSIIIPNRNEQFCSKTVQDVLAKAVGEIEVIVVADGAWPDPPLPEDPRIVVLHKGVAEGMRPAINSATRIAYGDYFLKLDAHCMVAPGFDEVLKAECEDNWIVVPRRYSLEPESWTILETGKSPIDAHYLSYPFEYAHTPERESKIGMHGTVWPERARARKDILVDDEMSSQGSCWFMSRKHWARLGEMDIEHYGSFIQENQELANKVWLSGGRQVINKKTWYAHLHKGQKYGRGYVISKREHRRGVLYAIDYWMNDRLLDRVHDLRWLVERFWPVPSWPTTAAGALDWDEVERAKGEFASR